MFTIICGTITRIAAARTLTTTEMMTLVCCFATEIAGAVFGYILGASSEEKKQK